LPAHPDEDATTFGWDKGGNRLPCTVTNAAASSGTTQPIGGCFCQWGGGGRQVPYEYETKFLSQAYDPNIN